MVNGNIAEGLLRPGRRLWPEVLKRQIVAETRMAGSSVSVVARRHGVCENLVFTWRRRFETGSANGDGRLVPVAVEPIAALFDWPDNQYTEGEFLTALLERT